jgi:hypothetical protein
LDDALERGFVESMELFSGLLEWSMNIRIFLLLVSLFGVGICPAEDLVKVSSAVTPLVGYGAERVGGELVVTVAADAFAEEEILVELGVSGERTLFLSPRDAKVTRNGDGVQWRFVIPADGLVDDEAGWKELRFAFAIEWQGGAFGAARQRERFLHLGAGAGHGGLSKDPREWAALDLEELARDSADRALQIRLAVDLAVSGKGSVVIEDPAGRRVRNLVSGLAMEKGRHSLVWDGLDEAGNPVPPGDYRWRSVNHPGLKPVHVMDFCDARGSNHGTLHAAATNGRSLFFASPVAEGGWEIIELAGDGTFVRGFNPPHGHGLGRVAIAADEDYLYAAHDGMAWGVHLDRSEPGWKEERTLSVVRISLASGQVEDFPGGVRHSPLKRYEAGPGVAMKAGDFALAGLALWEGKLYLADRDAGQVHAIDPATGKRAGGFDLVDPVALSASTSGLYAISGSELVKIENDAAVGIASLRGDPKGLHVAEDSRFYISDADEEVVRVLDQKGDEERQIGTPGGIAPGPYEPMKLQNPAGLVLLDGRLWVTEDGRWQPKRLAAFDRMTGEVMKEFFGPTNYGAQGAGFDEADVSRWIGQGAMWQLDFQSGTAEPVSILGGKAGRRSKFFRQSGRTFVIASGKATWIQELKEDGTLKLLACISSAHQFSYEHDWRPPTAFVEAFQRDYPDIPYTGSADGRIEDGKPNHGYGMLWVDRDGDGAMQAAEIEFSTTATSLAGAGWSHDFHNLTIRVPGEIAGKKVMVTLKPEGWWPGGAPRYPALAEAVRSALEIDLSGSSMVESITDRAGNLILNSDPEMRSIAPDGSLRWTYPNKWSNVHGSHRAPLPRAGELQGSLFYSGLAPLDETSDVFVINGNHGRAFVMTSDGLYLDEMFPDVRMMTNPQAGGVGILGGECFGGTFGRSEKDGNYYFQGGGIAYRIYRIDGLREVVRSAGTFSVSPAQAAAAERHRVRLAVESGVLQEAIIPSGTEPSDAPVVKWDRDGRFPVVVRACHDGIMLHLQYEVEDSSPWVNHGKDWQALFKTGDGVDLQLGPAADPKRGEPVPGDLRLFIAPMGEENVAVLYRHRAPDAPAGEAVNFQSPWRSAKVDSVRRLGSVKVEVMREGGRYRIKASVPLLDLRIDTTAGLPLRGDFGVIYGDAAGTVNLFRNYWANPATGLVNDVPGEILLTPALWGDILFRQPAASK